MRILCPIKKQDANYYFLLCQSEKVITLNLYQTIKSFV